MIKWEDRRRELTVMCPGKNAARTTAQSGKVPTGAASFLPLSATLSPGAGAEDEGRGTQRWQGADEPLGTWGLGEQPGGRVSSVPSPSRRR